MPGFPDGQSLHVGMADSITWRVGPTRQPGRTRRQGTGQEEPDDGQGSSSAQASVEQIVQLVIGAVNALAQLLDAIHRVR
jgi:hypothetical protein